MTDVRAVCEPVSSIADASADTPAAAAKPPNRWRGPLEVVGLTALFAALILGWAWRQSGSPSLIWPYLQGERLLFDPLHVVIDDAPAGTIIERPVRVLNRTSSTVTLLGAQQSCGCITLDEFPVEIPAGHDHTLTLKIGIPSEPGPFEQSVKVFTDYETSRSFVMTLHGM